MGGWWDGGRGLLPGAPRDTSCPDGCRHNAGMASDSTRREAERTLAERTRYVVDDEAAQRFLTTLELPSPAAEEGLRRLIEKPSVLPSA